MPYCTIVTSNYASGYDVQRAEIKKIKTGNQSTRSMLNIPRLFRFQLYYTGNTSFSHRCHIEKQKNQVQQTVTYTALRR